MAAIQAAAGLQSVLQFGEVQWWYFPNNGSTDPAIRFRHAVLRRLDAGAISGRVRTGDDAFTTNTADPTSHPDEVAFLQTVLGNFTAAIMTFVRTTQPSCRFEVLYPLDVNDTAFNSAINFPPAEWTSSALTSLKTEGFGYTLGAILTRASRP